MQEGEQRLVALALDAQVVEASLARRQPVRLEAAPRARQRAEERPPALPEQRRVAQLVFGVAQVQPAQQGVRGQLRCAGEVAPAVRLGLREAQELAPAAVRVARSSADGRTASSMRATLAQGRLGGTCVGLRLPSVAQAAPRYWRRRRW